jgi:hypothetical protein
MRYFAVIFCFLALVFSQAQETGNIGPALTNAGITSPLQDGLCLVDYYFVPGCQECSHIENNVLNQVKEMFGDKIHIRKHNLYDSAEYAAWRDLSLKKNFPSQDNVFIVVSRKIYLGGRKDIEQQLIPAIENELPASSGFAPSLPGIIEGDRLSIEGLLPFSLITIVTAGLIDGLNPCAFATIIFLVSMMAARGGRRPGMFWLGGGFCVAVFMTYLLIGLGFFQVFRLSLLWHWLNISLNLFLMVALVAMAVISFRDALVFRISGRPDGILLKLPENINHYIHHFISTWLVSARERDSSCYYLVCGFLVGTCVTLLESLCTGQLYLPTLAFLAWTTSYKLQAFAMLGLYNLMFVLPLIAVLLLVYRGAGSVALISWGKKHAVFAKCLMGAFFLFLASVLFFLQFRL